MSTGPRQQSGQSQKDSVADRTKKAQASRAITQSKVEKLDPQTQYALKQLRAAKSSLDAFIDAVVDGKPVSGIVLSNCALLQAEIGQCMFRAHS